MVPMKVKRRNFLMTSLAAGAGVAAPGVFAEFASTAESEAQTLPWQREIPVRKAAGESISIEPE